MVHCLTGYGRAIVVLIAFFMKHKAMKYQDAYTYIQRKRKLISFDQSLEIALKQFQKSIQSSISQNEKNSSRAVTYQSNLKI